MIAVRHWISQGVCLGMFALAGHAGASPVVYTLQTVADGRLGNHVFTQALVTFVMRSDTKDVQQRPSSTNDGTIFTNTSGSVEVSVAQNGRTTVAHFGAGEVWVYYDTGTGIAGFGSAISPSYPVSLGCANSFTPPASANYTQDCLQGAGSRNGGGYDNGTLAVLAYPSTNFPSAQTRQLPRTLKASTLLTGGTHTCATTYTDDEFGDLLVCGGAWPTRLMTDHGAFYLQDHVGASNDAPVGAFGDDFAGWEQSNFGFLRVEVEDQ